MTKSERRIAEYIAADPERLMKLTIPHIAAETDSSEITVSRFCKKLGYKGLQELKQALTAYLSMNELKNYHDIKAEDTCNAVTSKIFQNIADGLLDTLQLLDYEQSIGLPPSCGKPGELPYTVSAIRLRSVAI